MLVAPRPVGRRPIRVISQSDIDFWPTVASESITSEQKRARFLRLVDAVIAYVNAKPLRDVCEIAKLSERRFFTILQNCQELDVDGRVRGFRALVSGPSGKGRVRQAERSASSQPGAGYSGYFSKLLRDHDSIERGLKDILLRRGASALQPTVLELRALHKSFIALCQDEKIDKSEYPFCVEGLAKRPLSNWVKRTFTDAHAIARIRNEFGEAAAKNAAYSQGDGAAFRRLPPWKEWQLDEYTVDLEANYQFLTADGSWIEVPAKRYQVVALISTEPVLCLAVKLVVGVQVRANDILELLWAGLTGKSSVIPSINGLKCLDGAGFPADLIEELRGLPPAEVKLDNALAHLAAPVQEMVLKRFGATCRLGRPGTPKERVHIEREFKELAERLIQQMPSTTGSDPKSHKRHREPRVLVPLNDLEHAIQVYFQNKNALPSASANYASPLEQIERMISRGMVPLDGSRVPIAERHLFHAPTPVKICGAVKTGKAPHVNYLGQKYTSAEIQMRFSLIGGSYDLYCDPDDLRWVWIYERGSGRLFSKLHVIGRWATFKHNMRIRRMWLLLKRHKEAGDRPQDDPLHFLFEKLRKLARSNPSAATQYSHFMHFLASNATGGHDPLSIAYLQWSELIKGNDLAAFLPVLPLPAREIESPAPVPQWDRAIPQQATILQLPDLTRRRVR